MAVLFGSVSVLCLIYYGIIVAYSGFRTAFSGIWLVLAFLLAVMGAVSHFYGRFRDRIPLWLSVSAVTVAVSLFVTFLVVEAAIGFNFVSFQNQSVDYVIVLGTQVRGDQMSKTLRYRAEQAADYAQLHPNTVLVLSGGQGPGENVSEADIMYDYLRDHGVPEYQLIKEEQSTSTYENMVYSKLIIDEREQKRRQTIRDAMEAVGYELAPDEDHNIHIGIVTSNFHMLRAKGIAKKIGISSPYGISAKSDPVLFVHFCMRECFAILKDKFMGNM